MVGRAALDEAAVLEAVDDARDVRVVAVQRFPASSLIGSGRSGSSRGERATCGGESSNSRARAKKRPRVAPKISDINAQASLATATGLAAVDRMLSMVLGKTDRLPTSKILIPCRAMTTDNGIEVRGLVREFKGGIRAVDGIDLEVHPGEIYGFLGPNGAGKSTTVHMLTTLLPPTAGRRGSPG